MTDRSNESNESRNEIAHSLQDAHSFLHTLPDVERRIAAMVANGRPVSEIAHDVGQSEAAVQRTLNAVVAAVTGRKISPVEGGGLGADTDPGVTGGYGDTGFGAVDTEPIPNNEEPDQA